MKQKNENIVEKERKAQESQLICNLITETVFHYCSITLLFTSININNTDHLQNIGKWMIYRLNKKQHSEWKQYKKDDEK